MNDFINNPLIIGDRVAVFWADGQLAEGTIAVIQGRRAKIDVYSQGRIVRSKWKSPSAIVKLESK